MKPETRYEIEFIYELLNQHKRLTAGQIARMTNTRPDEVRDTIRSSRRELELQLELGVIVASKKGYYITDSRDEIVEQALSLIKRGNDITKTGTKMLQLLERMGK